MHPPRRVFGDRPRTPTELPTHNESTTTGNSACTEAEPISIVMSRGTICPECERRAFPKDFAQAVRWDRRRRELSCREYAKLIGISAPTVNRVENGHLPDLHSAIHLGRLLGKEWFDELIRKALVR